MQDTRTFHEKESRSSLKIMGTPCLVSSVDEATGEKVVKEAAAFVPVWKQTATDEQGRKRFHGAFTGGFSAGYFNTVGSKEGWTPQTFTSSRNARAAPQQAVTDFMDEEDLAMGLKPTLAARNELGMFGEAEAQKQPSSLEHAMTMMLNRAPDEKNIGLSLMRKMGWRDGTGIGPIKIMEAVLPAETSKKLVIGPSFSRAELEQAHSRQMVRDEAEAQPRKVAPRDVGVVRYELKDNVHGLGYSPYAAAPELERMARQGPKKKATSARETFGFGVFDEPDGYDPFEVDDRSNFDQFADVGRPAEGRGARSAVPEKSSKKCSDGRPPLSDFVLGSVFTETVKYPAVVVPPNWTPTPPVCDNMLSSASTPSLTQWALAATRKAIAAAALQQVKQEQLAAQAPPPPPPPPQVVASAANLAPSVAVPFPSDPAKQARYQNWLVAENGFEGIWANAQRPSADEIVEFVKLKTQWSAVPAGMSDRFAVAGEVIPVKNEEEIRAEEFRRFGKGTTRFEEEWAPVSLLCRRWNVKDPFADSRRTRPESAKPSGPADLFPALTRELERQFGAAYHAQMEMVEAEAALKAEQQAEEMKKQNPDEKDIVAVVRPSQDVFTAIFNSDRPTQVAELESEKFLRPRLPQVAPGVEVVDVDSLPPTIKRERPEEGGQRADADDILAGIFGGTKKSKTLELLDFLEDMEPKRLAAEGALQPEPSKKSKTLEMLGKTSAVKEFVADALDDKNKKKKKKKDSKKKKKKKKDSKKEEKYIYI